MRTLHAGAGEAVGAVLGLSMHPRIRYFIFTYKKLCAM